MRERECGTLCQPSEFGSKECREVAWDAALEPKGDVVPSVSLLTSVVHFASELKLPELQKLPEDCLVYARFQAFAFAR
jgi:hypothetical protein